MDHAALVRDEIEGGSEVLDTLRSAGFDVTAAFWVKESDADDWYFYIATSDVDRYGPTGAYRRLHEMMGRDMGPIDRFRIKLIGSDSAVAREVLEIQKRYPAPLATRYQAPRLGPIPIDAAYIYPVASP
jgi:hypothetical protein